MKKIITTVGTSIFTNYQKSNQNLVNNIDDEIYLIEKNSDSAKEYHHHQSDISELKKRVQDFFVGWQKDDKNNWNKNPQQPNEDICAEVKSVLAIANANETKGEEIEVYLIATDTILSVVACELIQEWFAKLREKPFEKYTKIDVVFDREKDFIQHLNVKEPARWDKEKQGNFYDEGIFSLFKKLVNRQGGIINKIKRENQGLPNEDKSSIIINFSGGYKAVIPILTIIAQLEQIPLSYIYDESDYLMEFGNLPINFDFGKAQRYYLFLKEGITYLEKNSIEIPNFFDLIQELQRVKLLSYQENKTNGKV